MPGATVDIFGPLQTALDQARAILKHERAEQAQREQDLREEIKRLKGSPVPGDGDKVICGLTLSGGGGLSLVAARDSVAGGFRHAVRSGTEGGIRDFAVPSVGVAPSHLLHPLAYRAWEAVSAGRVPVLCGSPGIEALAAKRFGPELQHFFRYLLSLPGLSVVVLHPVPERTWPDDHGNLTRMAQHAEAFRESQRWVRSCVNQASEASSGPGRIMFLGSLGTVSWSGEGKQKHGPPDSWNPGLLPGGGHVWDACGLEHWTEPGERRAESARWMEAVASLRTWQARLAVTALGVRREDGRGGAKLKAFLGRLAGQGCALVVYADLAAGVGEDPGRGWSLDVENGTLGEWADFVHRFGVAPNQPR
jgi:hypothetical protein